MMESPVYMLMYTYLPVFTIMLLCLTIANASVIITSPKSATVCAGRTAEFTCVTGSGASLGWTVDGVDAYIQSIQSRNITFLTTSYYNNGSYYGYTSTLSVYGSRANSNSSIQCTALSNNQIFGSDVVILLVQGNLKAALNVAAAVLNSTHLALNWSPPGDSINPGILNYIVRIWNGSATAQITTSVNETRVIVLLSALSTCGTVFIVQPMCATTVGDTTTLHWRMDANTTSIDVKIELTGDASKITIHGTTVCYVGYYNIAFVSSSENWNFTVESFGISANFTSVVSVDHNEKFIANVTIYDNYKLYKTGELIFITTFDVTTVRLLETSSQIQCSFNVGSTAKGCLVLLIDGNTTYYHFVRRNGTSLNAVSEVVQGLPFGNYTLLVYDLEATGTPSMSPAVSDSVSIVVQNVTAAVSAADKNVSVIVTMTECSICIDCGSSELCCALIRALNSTELFAYRINASQCVTMYGFGNYSVAVYAVGYDGVIESSSPLVTKLIDIYCQGRPAVTNLPVAVSELSQHIYIESALSVCCALFAVLLVATLAALVNTARKLKKYKAECKQRAENARANIEMSENAAYSSICVHVCDKQYT